MSLAKTIVNTLRKTRLFIPLRITYSLLIPRLRIRRHKERAELANITAKVGRTLRQSLYGNVHNPKSVLFIGMGDVRSIALESVLRKSFEVAGYRCLVVIPQDDIVIKAYRQLGSDTVIHMDQYQTAEPDCGARMLDKCKNLSELTVLSCGGVRCGKYAVSTLMRKTRTGSFDLTNIATRKELEHALNKSLQSIRTARTILNTFEPNAVVMVDRGYTPSGEFFDTCIEKNIPVFTWNMAHRNDSLMLKRYNSTNRDVHPSSLSEDTWAKIKALPWTAKHSDQVLQELERCYMSGEWYSEVGTQFNKISLNKESVLRRLGLDARRKTAAIFPHIFWDATFFWGVDLFESYEEWFLESVKVACNNTAINWIIKIHPANRVKDYRDGISAEHSELTAIRRAIGELPPHVKVLDADTEISTLSLLKAIDVCVTVRGTVGVEAACFGVPVLTAGTGRYDGFGFTIDSTSREEYLCRLAMAQDLTRQSSAKTELALKYAWGVLIGRPVSLTALRAYYRETESADLTIDFRISGIEELRKSADLNAISTWIHSGREDFLSFCAT